MAGDSLDFLGHTRPEADALLNRVATMAPRWRKRMVADSDRCDLADDTVDALFHAGLLQITMPKERGGAGLDWPILVEASRIAARASPSIGWMISLVGGHIQCAVRFPQPCVDRIFEKGSFQLIATASATPASRLREVSSNYEITGSWRLCSGIKHATWAILSTPLRAAADGESVKHMCLLPAESLDVVGNWNPVGLRGTGSSDVQLPLITLDGDYVRPSDQILGSQSRKDQQYLQAVPLIPYLTSSIIGPVLGCAEGALSVGVEQLRATIKSSTKEMPREFALQIGQIDANIASARLLYGSILKQLHSAGVAGHSLTGSEYAQIMRDRASVALICLNSVQLMSKLMGTSIIDRGSEFQILYQDLQVMTAHMDVNWHRAMIAAGQSLLLSQDHPFSGSVTPPRSDR